VTKSGHTMLSPSFQTEAGEDSQPVAARLNREDGGEPQPLVRHHCCSARRSRSSLPTCGRRWPGSGRCSRTRLPEHSGTIMGVYTIALSGSAAVAAAITVPLSELIHQGWRGGLGAWVPTPPGWCWR
jgi:hypothetical protein